MRVLLIEDDNAVARSIELMLKAAGFKVSDPPEGHLCCGSAGTYNIMQPEIATQLKARKIRNLQSTKPEVIATGNIGCITQIASGMDVPVVHTAELLNWAYGGPKPESVPEARPETQRTPLESLAAAE